MKEIKVTNEGWFKQAPFHDVKMLGIKFLDIPATAFENDKKPEHFKRALVRQAFVQKGHKIGEVFTIVEQPNPFGQPKKRRTVKNNDLTGEYKFVKNGLRAPSGDIRYELMDIIAKFSTFEQVVEEVENKYGKDHIFPTTGKLTFNIQSLLSWALKLGWIIKV